MITSGSAAAPSNTCRPGRSAGATPSASPEAGGAVEQERGRAVGEHEPAVRGLGRDRVRDAFEDRPDLGLLVPHQLLQAQVLQRHRGLRREVLEQVALDRAERRRVAHHRQHVVVADADRERVRLRGAERELRQLQLLSPLADRDPRLQPAVLGDLRQAAGVGPQRLDRGREQDPLQPRAILGLVAALQPPGLAAQVLGAGVERAGGAPERALELQLVLDPPRALPGDQPEQRRGRDRQQVRVVVDLGRARGEEPDRGERRVDHVHEREHRQELGGRDPRAEPLTRGRGRVVARELGEQREAEHRQRRLARQRHDERGRDRVPAVGDDDREPLRVRALAQQVRQLADHGAERDQQRHGRGGREEEHRHERPRSAG